MNASNDPPEPTLAPPGAGLPWIELKIASWMVHSQIRKATRESSTTLLSEEMAAILRLVRVRSNETCARRVLIKRLRGLEDSSRYWSVFMTLDHLRIVNNGIVGAITLLGQGKVPDREASTATVKPRTDVDETVVEEFVKSCEALEQAARSIPDLHTRTRYPHPWFGELDVAGWYFMSAFHLRLHRKQIEAILSGL